MAHPFISLVAVFDENAALRLAAQAGVQDLAAGLIQSGADINAGALHRAALLSDSAMLRFLLSKTANPNMPDRQGFCPLHFAVYGGNPESVASLLNAGAEINARGAKGWSCLHIAALGNEKTLCEALPRLAAPARMEALPRERRKNEPRFVDMARMLLGRGAQVNATTNTGDTPLHFACRWAFTGLVSLMLDRGADVNARNIAGEFPLLWLSLVGAADLARVVIERGAEVNAKTGRGATALHVAALHGHAEVVALLVKKGADTCARSQSPQGEVTPLDLASTAGHCRIVDMLQRHGTP
jgi:uncharacterized protein